MSTPFLSSRDKLADALHDSISGDFLLDAAGPGVHVPIREATAADVVRWAVDGLLASGVVHAVDTLDDEDLVDAIEARYFDNDEPIYDTLRALAAALDAR